MALALVLGASRAHAEPTPQERTLATSLFAEAKTLLDDGKVAEACRKLEESRRLVPLPGTILNLAACHEREGRLATAYAEFREARTLAERDHRDDRVTFADEHLRAIEPRISQLVVVVEGDAEQLPDLRVSYDGIVVGKAAWGARIPVDPGEHVVEAIARGKRLWRATVVVGLESDVQRITIGPLEDEPAAEAPPPATLAPAATADVVGPPPPSGLSTRKTVALVAAGVGVVGLGLGTYFAVRAFDKHNDDAALCTTVPCSGESVTLNEQAKSAADASTASFVAGLVVLGVAAFLWFGDTEPRAARRVSPLLTF